MLPKIFGLFRGHSKISTTVPFRQHISKKAINTFSLHFIHYQNFKHSWASVPGRPRATSVRNGAGRVWLAHWRRRLLIGGLRRLLIGGGVGGEARRPHGALFLPLDLLFEEKTFGALFPARLVGRPEVSHRYLFTRGNWKYYVRFYLTRYFPTVSYALVHAGAKFPFSEEEIAQDRKLVDCFWIVYKHRAAVFLS